MKYFIGSSDGTGEVADSKEDFFRRLEDYIQTALENEQDFFTITLEDEFKEKACEYEGNSIYHPSSTNRDYGPSNPWDAPGMSIKDFI